VLVPKPTIQIDEETLEAYFALERMQGIDLASLRLQSASYATLLKFAFFFVFGPQQPTMDAAMCRAGLAEYLTRTAPWLRVSAEVLYEALLQAGLIREKDGVAQRAYEIHSPWTREQALCWLTEARDRDAKQRAARRAAIAQRNRSVNAKHSPAVDPAEDVRFMQEALSEAERGLALGEVPVGAVLVRAGRVLARACNRIVAKHDPTAHAELLALREACAKTGFERLVDSTLYVTLEPCPMCTGALLLARVTRVVWGADDVKAGACGGALSLQERCVMNHRFATTRGVLAEPCKALLERFFQSRREGTS